MMVFLAIWAIVWYPYQIRILGSVYVLPFITGRTDKDIWEYLDSVVTYNIYQRVIPTVIIAGGITYLLKSLNLVY